MEWISHNLAFVVLAAGVIGAWAVNNYRINALEARLIELAKEVHIHQSNTQLHIDPSRDHAIWQTFKDEMNRRLDTIDGKIDKLMLVQPVPPL